MGKSIFDSLFKKKSTAEKIVDAITTNTKHTKITTFNAVCKPIGGKNK